MREVEQSRTIVVELRDEGWAIRFLNGMKTDVRGAQRNTMAIGVRDEWIDRVAYACAIVTTRATPRTDSARKVFANFANELPDPKSSVEQAVLRAMLVDVSLRWGHADHWAYHAVFPDAECTEDPAAAAMAVWHESALETKALFQHWVSTYLAAMERVHPRYRAVELQRDLDADFARPLHVTRLARQRGVSVRCLQRDFQELTGRTVQEYVRERRLDAAVRMLQDTSDKVEWIASVVGWSSRKNLNRALARSRGTSPSTLRDGGIRAKGRVPRGTGMLTIAALFGLLSACSRQPDFDLIVRGGTVYDGTGEASGVHTADVGISGDRIRAVGDLAARRGGVEIDASGKAVAPGFIDVRSRSGLTLLADGEGDGHLRQGITSEILADGSPALWNRATADASGVERYGIKYDWSGVAGYFSKLESHGTAINVGTLIPMSLVANGVDPNALIEAAMRDGAFGIVDDRHTGTEELTAAALTASRNGGIAMVPADGDIASNDDALVAFGTHARRLVIADVAHASTDTSQLIGRIVRAIARKVDVVAAVIPYPSGPDQPDSPSREALKFGGSLVVTNSAAIKDSTTITNVHPAAFGAFPRLLAMTREPGGMELREAVRRATSAAARVYDLQRRGIIRENYYADLVVFDPHTVADRATFDKPNQYPVGIDYVIVNGVVELTPRGVTGARAGTRLVRDAAAR